MTARYPSHLHIDMVPRLQSGGNGRRLMTTLTAALREQGSPGVHLGVYAVNTRAVGFYRHVGFTELSPTTAPSCSAWTCADSAGTQPSSGLLTGNCSASAHPPPRRFTAASQPSAAALAE